MSTAMLYAQMPSPQQWSTQTSTTAIETLPIKRIVTVQELVSNEPTTKGMLIIQENEDEEEEEEGEKRRIIQPRKPLPKIPSIGQRHNTRLPLVMQELRESLSWDRRMVSLEPIVEDQDTRSDSDPEPSVSEESRHEESEDEEEQQKDSTRDLDISMDSHKPVIQDHRSSDGWQWSTSQSDLSQASSTDNIIIPSTDEPIDDRTSLHAASTDNFPPAKAETAVADESVQIRPAAVAGNTESQEPSTDAASDHHSTSVSRGAGVIQNPSEPSPSLVTLRRRASKELVTVNENLEEHGDESDGDNNNNHGNDYYYDGGGFTTPISFALQQQQQESVGPMGSSTSLCSHWSSVHDQPAAKTSSSVKTDPTVTTDPDLSGWSSVSSSRLCQCTRYDSHDAGCIFATGPSEAGPVPLHPSQSTPSSTTGTSRLSIASFSLTHDKDAIKTYRRMAAKTNDRDVQMTYAKYLLEVAELYQDKSNPQNAARSMTRRRLLEEAEYWMDRLAKAGKAEALLIKGRWLLEGPDSGCVGDTYQRVQPTKAGRCFQAAAKTGCVEAQYELARYWKQRDEMTKAVACYKSAASKGHLRACYKMAKILLRGQLNQKKNTKLGLEYLKRAADMNGSESAEPAFVLSCVYSDDLDRIGLTRDAVVPPKDALSALHYLQKAESFGLPVALFQLGLVHQHGLLGYLPDPAQAFHFFARAAENGHEPAMLSLSYMYAQGIQGYLTPHPDMAFKWCQRAADKGLAQAEYTLGTCYETGNGVPADYARALEYFGKAASKGYPPAEERLNLPGTRQTFTSPTQGRVEPSNCFIM
ncbi:hypothetical protein DFQ28_005265 [Apophysomyces sp. BC1034]|nr:hypothetical protein DFQ30_003430 [Apophysomyces sp. BC1015]KAG0193447.1 hypothetical protein DFQ28_005265 [Apophysomyces sp. BC1034]